jgi:hypothetical protein
MDDKADREYTRRYAHGEGRAFVLTIARACARSGDHRPLREALMTLGLEEGTPEWEKAIAAFLEMCRRQRST